MQILIANFLETPSVLKDPLEKIICIIFIIDYYRGNVFSNSLKNCSFSINALERGPENHNLENDG